MRDFRRLQVWEKAHQLTLKIYQATACFPTSELYGLRSQLRRAATSIPSNIAEGAGRKTDTDFARFIDIATGSANEVEYQVLLARDLGFLKSEVHAEIYTAVNEVKKMLHSFAGRLRDSQLSSQTPKGL